MPEPEFTQLHDIVVAQDRLVPSVRRPVGGHKVRLQPVGKAMPASRPLTRADRRIWFTTEGGCMHKARLQRLGHDLHGLDDSQVHLVAGQSCSDQSRFQSVVSLM